MEDSLVVTLGSLGMDTLVLLAVQGTRLPPVPHFKRTTISSTYTMFCLFEIDYDHIGRLTSTS